MKSNTPLQNLVTFNKEYNAQKLQKTTNRCLLVNLMSNKYVTYQQKKKT